MFRAIQEALRRLVLERGEAILVVDALDELCTGDDFLPRNIPVGSRSIYR